MPNPQQQNDAGAIEDGAIVNIVSLKFPNVVLRMDGRGVTEFLPSGGGVVNCQFGPGAWERFRIQYQRDGTVAIESVQFPGVYLRMDGTGVTMPTEGGGGVVNCQFGVGDWETFRIMNSRSIASVHFSGACLRMDGTGVTQPTGSGGGIVNCQFGAVTYSEYFQFVPA